MNDYYDRLRKFVGEAIAQRNAPKTPEVHKPSRYWNDFCKFDRYVTKLPPEELEYIRYHTWHFTAEHYQYYYFGFEANKNRLVEEYLYLSDRLGIEKRFTENDKGIGFDTDYGKISIDLVRYLMILVELAEHKAIRQDQPQTLMEIGGGYGGLARLCMEYNPSISYVLMDLEESLFYQGTHLYNFFGADRIVLCETPTDVEAPSPGKFYLVPQCRCKFIESLKIDTAINHQSMQEMNRQQVEHYCALLEKTTDKFFSCNLHHHRSSITDKKDIIVELNVYLKKRFPEILWDSEKHDSVWARFFRRQPRLDYLQSGMRILASQNETISKFYQSLTGKPIRRFSDARLVRLLLRCR